MIEDSPDPTSAHGASRPVLPASATESRLSSARKRKAAEPSDAGQAAKSVTNGSTVHSSQSESNLGRKRRRVDDQHDGTQSSSQSVVSTKRPRYEEYKPPRGPSRRVLNADIRVVHDVSCPRTMNTLYEEETSFANSVQDKSHSGAASVDDADGHFIIIPEQRIGRQCKELRGYHN